MTECCGQPSFCEKPCFHDSGRSTPGRAGDVAGVLEERGKRYGDFEGHAAISQSLKDAMRTAPGWKRLSNAQREGLEMVQHKIARMLNGDPAYMDNIVDINGYATLVQQSMEAGE